MADLYQQTCMKCGVHTDCLVYEDGFICYPACWDKEQTTTGETMKHTPGTWYVSKPRFAKSDQQDDRLVHTKDGRHIAETYQYQNDNYNDANGEAVANAYLIAAAPDLYDGCNAMLGLIQLILGRDDLTDDLRKVLDAQKSHRIGEAQQAIAKAKE